MKTCPQCRAETPLQNRFCGNCGYALSPDEITSISHQLAQLQSAFEDSKRADQRLVEWDTTERIAERLKKWGTIFLWFAAVPFVLSVAAFSIIAGKGIHDLNDLIQGTRSTIQPVLLEAQTQANDAKKLAAGAVKESTSVSEQVRSTRKQVSELDTAIAQRSSDTNALSKEVLSSRDEIEKLHKQLSDQTAVVQRLNHTVDIIRGDQSEQAILETYPILGEHLVGGQKGYIDVRTKKAGETYLLFLLSSPNSNTIRSKTKLLGDTLANLAKTNVRVFTGPISLIGKSGQYTAGIIGIASNSCGIFAHTSSPCVLYAKAEDRARAIEIAKSFAPIEDIEQSHIALINRDMLSADLKEVLSKSGIDYFVELN